MAKIDQMMTNVLPVLKELFHKFFEDKYSEATRNSIFEDLWELVNENIISEIQFCLWDSNLDKVTDGVVFKLDRTATNKLFTTQEVENIKIPKKSASTEKLLIIKTEETGDETDKEILNRIGTLKHKWDFIDEVSLNRQGEPKDLVCIDDLKIQWQGIQYGQ